MWALITALLAANVVVYLLLADRCPECRSRKVKTRESEEPNPLIFNSVIVRVTASCKACGHRWEAASEIQSRQPADV